MRESKWLSNSQLTNTETRMRETFLIEKKPHWTNHLSSIRTFQVCIGRGSDPASLYLPVIKMSLATCLSFILDFLRQIGDCSKKALELRKQFQDCCFTKAQKEASNSSIVWLAIVLGKYTKQNTRCLCKTCGNTCYITAMTSHSHTKTAEEGTCWAVDLIFRILLTVRITWRFLLMRIFGEINISRPPDKGL